MRGSAHFPGWVGWIPYFLSALLFMSFFFTVFSPLPVILHYFRAGRSKALIAVLTNTAFVGVTNGVLSGLPAAGFSAALYLVLAGGIAFLMPYFLFDRKYRPDRTVLLTLLAIIALGVTAAGAYWVISGISPIAEFRAQVSAIVDLIAKQAGSQVVDWELPPEEFKRAILVEFPSTVIILMLVVCWANLMILLRFNPKNLFGRLRLDPDYAKNWKSPDWMVWPTIASGAVLLLDEGTLPVWASGVALNLFKVLMAVYGIHGLSVLAFLLDWWKIRGFFRSAIYVMALFFLWPLVLAMGFFDLWFDFRGKIRQSLGT